MSAATPGQADMAALVRAAQAADYVGRPVDRNWTRVSDAQAARLIGGALAMALAAQEPHAADEPRPGYVTVDARDIAIALNGHAGFTGDPASFASELHERLRRAVFEHGTGPQPAPERFATEALARFADDGQWLTCTDDGRLDLRAELLAVKAAVREVLDAAARPAQPAPDLAEQVRLARADRDQLRKQVLDLAAELETSAARTAPSKKTDIENAAAAKLRKAAEPPS